MSLNGSSSIVVNTTREEGYDIQFRFKTTLSDGLVAIGKGSTYYILELVHGKLNLRSSLLNKWEGVFIGSKLSDSNWQKVGLPDNLFIVSVCLALQCNWLLGYKILVPLVAYITVTILDYVIQTVPLTVVLQPHFRSRILICSGREQAVGIVIMSAVKMLQVFVAINSSHLVLAANEEQTIYPINLNEANVSFTSFLTTYLGGTVPYLSGLIQGPSSFIGCTEDVIINGEWVLPNEHTKEELYVPVKLMGVEVGCPREDQCKPNPCHNGGTCTDLWRNFSCACERPYLGHTCQYSECSVCSCKLLDVIFIQSYLWRNTNMPIFMSQFSPLFFYFILFF